MSDFVLRVSDFVFGFRNQKQSLTLHPLPLAKLRVWQDPCGIEFPVAIYHVMSRGNGKQASTPGSPMALRSLFVVAGLFTLNRKQGLTPRSLCMASLY